MDWKKYVHWAVRVLDYLVPVAISAGLVIWLFHKVNFRDIIAVAREECDFLWVVVMMAITTLSHMVPAFRGVSSCVAPACRG